jgi:hypothetical protein
MSVYVPVNLQRSIRQQFNNTCAYCQTAEYLTVTTFEIEHIVPLSAGGQTLLENLCLACPSCNRYKAARQTAINPNTGQQEKLFNPQTQQWKYHFKWSEDGTEIMGITPEGQTTISALKMNRPQMIRVRKMWVKLGEHPPKI